MTAPVFAGPADRVHAVDKADAGRFIVGEISSGARDRRGDPIEGEVLAVKEGNAIALVIIKG